VNKIDTRPFELAAGELPKRNLGRMPEMKWLEIGKLVVDPTYQRDISRTSERNIVRIAREFDWNKFSTVIVASAPGGKYAIVDGQHRTTAAALRGIDKVPCQVIVAKQAEQAAAFAAINSVTTAMSPMQVHAAKLAAGDPDAVRLSVLCAKAGVTICRYPIQAKNMKRGETMAAGRLYALMHKFGTELLTIALGCISQTRDGNPGMLRAQLIEAFCSVLEAEPPWANAGPKLIAAVSKLDLPKTFSLARQKREGSQGGIKTELVEIIAAHLDRELGAIAA
jgi:hypothetical protein